MDVDQNDRTENLHDDKIDQSIGRNLYNLAHHPAMVGFQYFSSHEN